ncbi:hypothetical protein F5H01DRAFT_360223 [Linnemannia elongata]|nr:hypothetical protein F5H01DRAFT_360223 [Linnemannia elongata]
MYYYSEKFKEEQDRENSRLILGTSINTPLRFFSYCKRCDRVQQAKRRQEPMGKFKRWIESRLGEFESPNSALDTIMTVAVQGFCFGPAIYNSKEELYLCTMAKEASPKCFWSGLQLTVAASGVGCPTKKFTADRIVFHEGCALPYGAKEQFLVASSEFANYFFMDRTIVQRIQYLKKIEEEWEEGVKWADGVIQELQGGFDSQSEEDEAWTNQWEHRWKVFVKNKDFKGHRERVLWTKHEWRYFVKRCQGRSLVTGQVLEGKACHIDRVFNSDDYGVKNCLMMEQGLNFEKRDMLEFQTSSGFAEQCKLQYGVLILRNALAEPCRDNEDTQVSLEGGHSDRTPLTQQVPSHGFENHCRHNRLALQNLNAKIRSLSAIAYPAVATKLRAQSEIKYQHLTKVKCSRTKSNIRDINRRVTLTSSTAPSSRIPKKEPSPVQIMKLHQGSSNFSERDWKDALSTVSAPKIEDHAKNFLQEHVEFIDRLKNARKRSADDDDSNDEDFKKQRS